MPPEFYATEKKAAGSTFYSRNMQEDFALHFFVAEVLKSLTWPKVNLTTTKPFP